MPRLPPKKKTLFFFFPRSGQVFEVGLGRLHQEVSDLRQRLFELEFKLKQGQQSWESILNSFNAVKDRVNVVFKSLSEEYLPEMHDRVLVPMVLTTLHSEHLQTITEKRMDNFTHDGVPEILRTKLAPNLEEHDAELSASALSLGLPKRELERLKDQVDRVLNSVVERPEIEEVGGKKGALSGEGIVV
eukprot:m.305685 g.305685  ORF g.305685 m.305685 type:complete len:188 (+) comp23016_c0_seq6:147-710(+)